MTRGMWFASSVIAAVILAALIELASWYGDTAWTHKKEIT